MQRTGGTFQFGINHVGGAIFGRALCSPLSAAFNYWKQVGIQPTMEMMPDLRHGSDIMAAYWSRNNSNPKNLKYYFALGIANDETLQIMATCLHFRGEDMQTWPGTKFDATGTD